MKKLIVLSLVMAMASLATAGLVSDLAETTGNVDWTLDLNTGTLTGTGTSGAASMNFLKVLAGAVTGLADTEAAGDAASFIEHPAVPGLYVADAGTVIAPITPGVWFTMQFDFVPGTDVVIADAAGTTTLLQGTLVPEPMTLGLLGLGGLFLRRKK